MSSCGCQQTQEKEFPVISVNGEIIDEAVYSQELQYHQAGEFEQALQKAGQALVIRTLLKQQLSHDRGLQHDDEEAAFSHLIEGNVQYLPVEKEACKHYYTQNKNKFTTAPLLEVSHILLSAATTDVEARVSKKTLADDLIKTLQKEPDAFMSFAADYSECPSSKVGGSLGQLSKGQTVPEFERQLFTLREGLCKNPIETRYGFHIVFVSKRIAGKRLAFDKVEHKIRNYLTDRRYQQAVGEYLFELVDRADIQGIDMKIEQENIFFG